MNSRNNQIANPKLTVVVYNYNSQKYIEQCLTSILANDYIDYQLLIIDDFSQDNSLYKIPAFLHDKRIKLIKNSSKLGFAQSVNMAITQSNSQYITFIQADDYVNTSYLSSAMDKFTQHQVDSIFATIYQLDENLNYVINEDNNVFMSIPPTTYSFKGGEIFLVSNYFVGRFFELSKLKRIAQQIIAPKLITFLYIIQYTKSFVMRNGFYSKRFKEGFVAYIDASTFLEQYKILISQINSLGILHEYAEIALEHLIKYSNSYLNDNVTDNIWYIQQLRTILLETGWPTVYQHTENYHNLIKWFGNRNIEI